VTSSDALERVRATIGPSSDDRPVLAIGWATVDLDRAVADLALQLGTVPAAFLPAADSVVLGARCRVGYGVLPGDRPLAIVEPRTEGRLAAFLARVGEGPAVTWSRAPSPGKPDAHGPARPGPFGPERLVSGDPVHGPFSLLIVGQPGTIDG
jgi:hypothetical protein